MGLARSGCGLRRAPTSAGRPPPPWTALTVCVFRQDAYTSRECLGNPSGVLGIGERRGIELVIELRVRRLGFDSGLEEGDAAFGTASEAVLAQPIRSSSEGGFMWGYSCLLHSEVCSWKRVNCSACFERAPTRPWTEFESMHIKVSGPCARRCSHVHSPRPRAAVARWDAVHIKKRLGRPRRRCCG